MLVVRGLIWRIAGPNRFASHSLRAASWSFVLSVLRACSETRIELRGKRARGSDTRKRALAKPFRASITVIALVCK